MKTKFIHFLAASAATLAFIANANAQNAVTAHVQLKDVNGNAVSTVAFSTRTYAPLDQPLKAGATAVINRPGFATAGINLNSASPQQCTAYWNSAASPLDCWAWQILMGIGANPAMAYTLMHGRSSEAAMVGLSAAQSKAVTTTTANRVQNAIEFAGADIFAQANAALTAAFSGSTPCRVMIPPGTYNSVTTTLNMVSDCELDMRGATVNFTGSGTSIAISFCGVSHSTLRGGQLIGTKSTNTTGLRIGCTTAGVQTQNNQIYDLRIGEIAGTTRSTGFGDGIVFDGASGNNGTYFNTFYNVMSNDNARRGILCKPTTANFANQNSFYGGRAQLNGLDGVKIEGCSGLEFHGFSAENNNQNAAAAVTIATMSRASDIVTVTTAKAMNCTAGDVIAIAGAKDVSFNTVGTPAATCPTSTSFTFNQNGPDATSNTGTAQLIGCGWNYDGLRLTESSRIIGGWSESNGCDIAIGSSTNVRKMQVVGTTVNVTSSVSGQVNGVLNNFEFGQGGTTNDHFLGPYAWHLTTSTPVGQEWCVNNDEANTPRGELVGALCFNRAGADAGQLQIGTQQYPVLLRGPLNPNGQDFTGTVKIVQTAGTSGWMVTDSGPSGTLETSVAAGGIGAGSAFVKYCSTTTCGLSTGTEVYKMRGNGTQEVAETSAPAGASGFMDYWADSGDHFFKYNDNNAGEQHIPQVVVLHTAYTNATTTFSTLSDGTHSVSFAVSSNKDYTVSCKLLYQGSATTAGPRVQITGPSAPAAVMISVDGGTGAGYVDAGATAFSTPITAFGTLGAATTNFTLHLEAGIANGENPGIVSVQLAANGTGILTVQPGSYCRFQ